MTARKHHWKWIVAALALAMGAGLQQLHATRVRLVDAQALTAEAQLLADEIRALQRTQVDIVKASPRSDQALGHLEAIAQRLGTRIHIAPLTIESLAKGELELHRFNVELASVSQVQLMAFLDASHTKGIPLLASQIQLTTPTSTKINPDGELWDAKVLLTYIAHSGKRDK